MPLQLAITQGETRGQIIPLTEGRSLTVGRLRGRDVWLPDSTIAREHGILEVWDEQVYFRNWHHGLDVTVNLVTRRGSDVEVRQEHVPRGERSPGLGIESSLVIGNVMFTVQECLALAESQWLAETDLGLLLREVWQEASERQLRLFACGCCRCWLPAAADPRLEAVVTASEREADNESRQMDMWAVETLFPDRAAREIRAVYATTHSHPLAAALRTAELAAAAWDPFGAEGSDERHADLLRDVFGNPFRPVTLDPGWLHWNKDTVIGLAREICTQRRFDELPILADALEEAGCTVAELLDHCRSGRPHTRGCWALDLLLGRK